MMALIFEQTLVIASDVVLISSSQKAVLKMESMNNTRVASGHIHFDVTLCVKTDAMHIN